MATTSIDLPWFQFYANDFLAQTRRLSNEEVGIYSILMAASWLNGPLSLEAVQSWVGEGYESVLSRFFKPDQNGDLYHPKLEELRQGAIETAQKNRERTEKATAARWRSDSPSRIRHGYVSETDTQSHTQGQKQEDSHTQAHRESDSQPDQITAQQTRSDANPASAHSSAYTPEETKELAELERLWASTPQKTPEDRALRLKRRKEYMTYRNEQKAERAVE